MTHPTCSICTKPIRAQWQEVATESNVCAFPLVEWDAAKECANTRMAANHHHSSSVGTRAGGSGQ